MIKMGYAAVVLTAFLTGFVGAIEIGSIALGNSPSLDRGNTVVRYSGHLDRVAESTPSIIILLKAEDIRVCEDLGRQLRELQRSHAPETDLAIWVASQEDVEAVQEFLDDERVPATTKVQDFDRIRLSRGELVTPAAFAVDPDGALHGSGYPERARGVRRVTFVEELAPFLTTSTQVALPPGMVPNP